MNIGRVSKLCGLSCQTIRYYENIDLVTPKRTSNGYRFYTEEHVQELVIMKNARDLDFSTSECASLLEVYRSMADNQSSISVLVKRRYQLLKTELEELERKQNILENLLVHSISDSDFADKFYKVLLSNSENDINEKSEAEPLKDISSRGHVLQASATNIYMATNKEIRK